MSRLARLFPLMLLVPLACGSDKAAEGGDGDSSGDGSDDGSDDGDDDGAGDDGDDDDGGDDGSTDDGDGATDDGEPSEPILARNISIVRVEADSGITEPIGINGAAVPPSGRDTELPKNRNTMIRVETQVGPGWQPRELRAELRVVLPDSTEMTYKDTKVIEGDDYLTDLTCVGKICDPTSGKFFFFGVDGEYIQPGAGYELSIWETDDALAGEPDPDPPPVWPGDGGVIDMGIDPTYLDLEVVLVPIAYNSGGCTKTPNVDDANMQRYKDDIYQVNPIETLTFTVREPLQWTQGVTSANGLSSLVSALGQLRQQDGARPWQYYYGLIDNCGECIVNYPGCIVGMAAGSRASAGLIVPGPGTFTHEVGHTQGRAHVACPAQSAGPDPTYPYPDGVIMDWGFGVRDFGLRQPEKAYDYMSYCGPGWASDWQWNATYEVISELSAQKEMGAPINPGLQLVGVIEPDGSEQWWTETYIDRNAVEVADETITFLAGEDVLGTETALVAFREHGAKEIFVDIPEGAVADLSSVAYDDGTTTRTVRIDQIALVANP